MIKRYVNFPKLNNDLNHNHLRLVSSNIRCVTKVDTGKRKWSYRKKYYYLTLNEINADIIGLQEVSRYHMPFLKHILSDYDYSMVYRDKNYRSEACPIFYRRDLLDLIDKGTFWLSNTPDVISKDWGARCYRICSYVILKEKKSSKELVVFNAHLDHISEIARINSINLIREKIHEFGFDNKTSILLGDMNDVPNSKTIKTLFEMFNDSIDVSENKVDGIKSQPTFHGFMEEEKERIDYIAVSKNIKVFEYNVFTKLFDNVCPSDHYPIYIDFELK